MKRFGVTCEAGGKFGSGHQGLSADWVHRRGDIERGKHAGQSQPHLCIREKSPRAYSSPKSEDYRCWIIRTALFGSFVLLSRQLSVRMRKLALFLEMSIGIELFWVREVFLVPRH